MLFFKKIIHGSISLIVENIFFRIIGMLDLNEFVIKNKFLFRISFLIFENKEIFSMK